MTLAAALLAAAGRAAPAGLPVVPQVDLQRYAGKWYEIASLPQRFQEGCTATTATYTLRDDGKLGVLNECRLGSPDGEPKRAEGYAKIADPATNAKLRVTFFWPFFGDYWILELGPEYEYSVVGHPSRDYLWILGRSPRLPQATLDGILERAAALGFDIARLRYTEHRAPQ
jgi:apolipoprotein D and lipocalin family protein